MVQVDQYQDCLHCAHYCGFPAVCSLVLGVVCAFVILGPLRFLKLAESLLLVIWWGCVNLVLLEIFHRTYGHMYTYVDASTKTSSIVSKIPPRPSVPHQRIVCISDTHTMHKTLRIPDADILVVCGDILLKNSCFLKFDPIAPNVFGKSSPLHILTTFNAWLKTLPVRTVVVIGGNHDQYLSEIGRDKAAELLSNATYLENSCANIHGIQFLGIPASPKGTSRNQAWQYTELELVELVDSLNKETSKIDIIISHSKPFGLLTKFVTSKHPKWILCGHFHQQYGVKFQEKTIYVNCASMSRLYIPVHPPVVFDYLL